MASISQHGLRASRRPAGSAFPPLFTIRYKGKIGGKFADLGEQNLKNIDRPVRVYGLILDEVRPAMLSQPERSGTFSPPRLSIVVLPFTNLSGTPEEDYFVDGVTGSLTNDLSRISGSFVI